MLLFHGVLGSQPLAVLFHGFSGPFPGCFTFFTAIWRVFHSTKSNDFHANFSFGIIAAGHPWNQLNFDVTGFKNTTHRPLVTIEVTIFTLNWNVQYSADVLNLLHLLSRELHHVVFNDAFNISSLAHENRLCLTPRHAHRCLLRHYIGITSVLMSSHVFQVTSHIVGLLALCTGK